MSGPIRAAPHFFDLRVHAQGPVEGDGLAGAGLKFRAHAVEVGHRFKGSCPRIAVAHDAIIRLHINEEEHVSGGTGHHCIIAVALERISLEVRGHGAILLSAWMRQGPQPSGMSPFMSTASTCAPAEISIWTVASSPKAAAR